MKLLVTGVAGFIGSQFVRTAKDAGYEIVGIDSLTYAADPANIEHGVMKQMVIGDITVSATVEKTFEAHGGFDAVVNFAAETHVDNSISEGLPFIRTNVLGVGVLCQAALRHGAKRFLQVSTDEVYGGRQNNETPSSVLDPTSPYSASKAGGDLVALSYHKTHGLDVVVTRCCNNYGIRQHDEKFVPTVIRKLTTYMGGAPGDLNKIPVYGDGKNLREWIHVEDHCLGILAALEKGEAGKIYHFSGESFSNIDVVDKILKAFSDYEFDKYGNIGCDRHHSMGISKDDCLSFVEDRKGHDFRYSIDDWSTKAALGWERKRRFDDSLGQMIGWYMDKRKGAWEKRFYEELDKVVSLTENGVVPA